MQNLIKNRIQLYIKFYSQITQKFIDKIIITKSFEYLQKQDDIEKKEKALINIKFKRNRENFKDLISLFIKDNFYYIAQKYFIYIFIKDLLESLSERIGTKIIEKTNEYLSGKEIIKKFKKNYLEMIEDFEEEINNYRNSENRKIYN